MCDELPRFQTVFITHSTTNCSLVGHFLKGALGESIQASVLQYCSLRLTLLACSQPLHWQKHNFRVIKSSASVQQRAQNVLIERTVQYI